MRNTTAFGVAGLIVLLTILGWNRNSWGYEVRILDEDSAVFDAENVIEGQLLGPEAGRPNWMDDVKITAVYKGNLKVGEACIVSQLSGYLTEWGLNQTNLGAGNDVILFLQRDTNSDALKWSTDPFEPVSSGVRWIESGQVFSFMQLINPGPMMADGNGTLLENYRKSLKQRVIEMAKLHERLKSPLDAKDIPWLMQSLKDRTAMKPGDSRLGDDVMLALANRLGQFRDPDISYQAMSISAQIPVGLGFATAKGRDYLLAKFAAAGTSAEMRVRILEAIKQAGINYQYAAQDEKIGDWVGNGKPYGINNGFYATRVMRAVVSHVGEKKTWEAFVQMTNFWLDRSIYKKDPEYQKDISQAASVLVDFYKHGASEKQQYDVESILAKQGETEFQKLGLKFSPVDAIAEYNDLAGGPFPPPPYVLVRFECFCMPWVKINHENITSVQLIGKSQANGKEIVIDPDPGGENAHRFWNSGGFVNGVRLIPKDLTAGHYRIFLRFLKGTQVIYESHGFDVDENGMPVGQPAVTTRP